MVPTLTLKNIPKELYERLKQRAAEHRRSINSEILVCLERALLSERVDPQALLARADAVRERAALSPVTDELIAEARGRMARTPPDVHGERTPDDQEADGAARAEDAG